jgi:hypothetical protein
MSNPVISNSYVGNGSTVLYSFTFPYIEIADINVKIDDVLTTEYTFANATTIQLNSAPASGANVSIFRDTDDTDLKAVFFPGSAIRARDLNDNFTQALYVVQEATFDAGSATSVANQALDKADDALIDSAAALTAATAAENSAHTAETSAQSALSSVSSAVSASTQAAADAAAAQTAATSAQGFANTATTDAGTALTTANSAASAATQASTDATQASTDAATAISTANAASTLATTANTNATSALSGVSTAQTAANNATTAATAASTTATAAQASATAAQASATAAAASAQAVEDALEDSGVQSINTLTGAVVLDADDIDDSSTTNKFATSTQLTDIGTAVQPADLSTVATSGDYDDLTNKPTIPTIDPNTVIDANYVQTDQNFTDADHTKLDGIEAGAQVNAVTSVNGSTGAVTVTTFSGDYADLSNTPTIPSAAPVDSVNSSTGVVVLDAGDVGALDLTGGTMTGTLETTERTITASAFDLSTGNHWTCGAITVPNPSNCVAGTSGLIRITAGPVVWGSYFKFPSGSAPTIASFPAIIPFYVQSASVILLGNVSEGIS